VIGAVSIVQQTAETVLVCKFESITRVHHEFRREHVVRPPVDKRIRGGYEQFRERLAVWKNRHSALRPRRSDEGMDRVRQAFVRSLKKSTSTASAELQISQSTVHRIPCKSLCLEPYK
jgi:hypothetical protein